MSHHWYSFGKLYLPIASKTHACQAGTHCAYGGDIAPGTVHAYIMISKKKEVPDRAPIGDYAADLEIEGRSYGTKKVRWLWFKRLHLGACLESWALFQHKQRQKWLVEHPHKKGRPRGSGRLKILTDEERGRRRQLVRKRIYLTTKLLGSVAGTKEGLVILQKLRAIVGDIAATGVDLTPGRPGQTDRDQRVNAVLEYYKCRHRLGELCELGREGHCIHCARCFESTHVHV